jgi:hypothetical protein
MNSVDDRKGMATKLTTWKSKMYDFTRKIAGQGFKEREKVFRNNQDLSMPVTEMSSRIEHFNNERRIEDASQMKNIDNGFVDVSGKYVLRTRPSWTGHYGKEPWPRERKIWERV